MSGDEGIDVVFIPRKRNFVSRTRLHEKIGIGSVSQKFGMTSNIVICEEISRALGLSHGKKNSSGCGEFFSTRFLPFE